jgi:Winged helix-turn helix
MRTGRPKQPLTLIQEERDRLLSMAHRARSQPLLARRARVVLACAEGLDNQAAAKKLRCSRGMVGKWRLRFLKSRLEGLYDEPRPGAPRKVGDEQIRAGGDSDSGEFPTRADPLEHAGTGQSYRTESHDNQSDLARVWFAAASH